jgi:hypothetical protein
MPEMLADQEQGLQRKRFPAETRLPNFWQATNKKEIFGTNNSIKKCLNCWQVTFFLFGMRSSIASSESRNFPCFESLEASNVMTFATIPKPRIMITSLWLWQEPTRPHQPERLPHPGWRCHGSLWDHEDQLGSTSSLELEQEPGPTSHLLDSVTHLWRSFSSISR